jgi:hypothetical protein
MGLMRAVRQLLISQTNQTPVSELIIHVGMHKTGTTSIQRSLQGYDDGQTRYLDLGPMANHSIPVFSLYTEDLSDYRALQSQGLSAKQTERAVNDWKHKLHSEFQNHKRATYIMSGEDIGFISDEGKERLVTDMRCRVSDIRVVMYARRPLDFVVSAIQERIKNGHCDAITSPVRVGYARYCSAFQALLGKHKVAVFEFEKACEAQNGVLGHFSELLQLQPPSLVSEQNVRLNEPIVKLLFLLNRSKIELTRVKRLKIIGTLQRLYAGGNELDVTAFEKTFVVSEQDASLMEDHQIEVKRCKADRKAVANLAHYLTDVSTVDLAPLKEYVGSTESSDAAAVLSALCAHRHLNNE